MGYDFERHQARQSVLMPKGTFAGGLLGTTATNTNTQTSATSGGRIKFFQNIKLLGMKCYSQVAPDAGSHATSMQTKVTLTDGTTVFARSAALATAVASTYIDGSVLSANVTAGKSLRLSAEVTTWDGTVQTMAPGGHFVLLEYLNRF